MTERTTRGGSVTLLSGGMDSATCLALALMEAPPAHALTVLYGQRHEREIESARRLARRFHVRRHVVLELPIGPLLRSSLTDPLAKLPTGSPRRRPGIPPTYVPARNTVLLALALGYAESHDLGSIYLGVNAVDYSGYPDCRPEFLSAFREVARLATRVGVEGGRPIEVRAPLVRLSKADIVRLGTRLGVPWELTWSCYAGGASPCGRCDACRLRAKGFSEAGVPDPVLTPRAPRSRRRRRNASPSC
jgi:7-cyano-7-deazaguanine synthase